MIERRESVILDSRAFQGDLRQSLFGDTGMLAPDYRVGESSQTSVQSVAAETPTQSTKPSSSTTTQDISVSPNLIPHEGAHLGPNCRFYVYDKGNDDLTLLIHTYLACLRVDRKPWRPLVFWTINKFPLKPLTLERLP